MKDEPVDELPHFFISSIEIIIAYIINYFVFFKYSVLGVINQIRYYEESPYVVLYMAITYILLGLIYLKYMKYKSSNPKKGLEKLIYFIIIIFVILGIMGLLVAYVLTKEYGTQYFLANYLKYLAGSVVVFIGISRVHKYIIHIFKIEDK